MAGPDGSSPPPRRRLAGGGPSGAAPPSLRELHANEAKQTGSAPREMSESRMKSVLATYPRLQAAHDRAERLRGSESGDQDPAAGSSYRTRLWADAVGETLNVWLATDDLAGEHLKIDPPNYRKLPGLPLTQLRVTSEQPPKEEAFHRMLTEVRRGRYIEPQEKLLGPRRYAQRAARAVEVSEAKKVWRLDDSAWKKRGNWADSGTFVDTIEVYERAFNHDWGRALQSHGLAQFIVHIDDGESDDGLDLDGDGELDDEITEVGHVLWEFHALIYKAFDAFASIGGGTDISHMSAGGFKEFVSSCKLAVPGSKYASKAHFDQLFLMVNGPESARMKESKSKTAADGAGARKSTMLNPDVDVSKMGGVRAKVDGPVKADTNKLALNRMEFLQCLVRIAIMRYVQAGKVRDVSHAVRTMFVADIEPNMSGAALQDSNDFRTGGCYVEDTDAVLVKYLSSLTALFQVYAAGEGGDVKAAGSASLMEFGEWMAMMRDLELIDTEFTVREATLAFVWARLRVADENAPKSKMKLQNLCLEDMFEALVRVATMKAMPTDAELADPENIVERPCADAGEFILRLKNSDTDHAEWVAANARRWDEPMTQPIHRAVEHLILLIIRTVEQGAAKAKENLVLTLPEVLSYRQGRGGRK